MPSSTQLESNIRPSSEGAWPRRVAILNDYVRIPYANGSSFASQMLYRELSRRGHEVTVVGPRDPAALAEDLPRRCLTFPGLALRNHPGVYLALPGSAALAEVERQEFDLTIGQTGSGLMNLGVWLRLRQGVPLLFVNTIHLASVYNVLLPGRLHENEFVTRAFQENIVPRLERHSAEIYNQGDGLIVLSQGLERYWRSRGVTAPITVIRRAVEPQIFDAMPTGDPFPAGAPRGARLLVVCRHTREKAVDRLLRLFASEIAPHAPDATLTLVGDGPDHREYRALAEKLGVLGRTFFTGELSLLEVADWYRFADVFVYTSLSETYGQVVSEAAWCGLPVVAFADDKGVSDQVLHGETGFLVEPGPNAAVANGRFAAAVLQLLREPSLRQRLGGNASAHAQRQCTPERVMAQYFKAFAQARSHCRTSLGRRSERDRDSTRAYLNWLFVHAAAAGVGLLREPSKMAISSGLHPRWDVDSGFRKGAAPAKRAIKATRGILAQRAAL